MSEHSISTEPSGVLPSPETVADQLAIQSLLARYCFGWDSRDYDLVAGLFLPEATFDYDSLGPIEGGFAGFLETCSGVLEQLASTQHLIANVDVRVEGDTARCTAYVQATHVAPDGRTFTGAGRYDDDLVRTGSGWKIKARTFRRQWGADPDGLGRSLGVGKDIDRNG